MTFNDYWAESALTPLTQRAFAERLAEHRTAAPALDEYVLPAPPVPLHRPKDRVAALFAARRSGRDFAAGPIKARDLGALLSALAETAPGRRAYPSAGGLLAVRAYPVLRAADHPLTGRVTRYDPVRHALQDVGACPPWERLSALVGCPPEAAAPPLLVVLALDDTAQFAKYGPRAGRFGLVEAGAAAQALALRAADRGLAGYLLGGAADRDLAALLGVPRLRIATVYACGVHPS